MSRLSQLAEETRTIVLYESPHRILKTLAQCAQVMGPDRQASISRELTKVFEETVRGTFEELEAHFTAHTPKRRICACHSSKKLICAGLFNPTPTKKLCNHLLKH